MSQSIPLVVYCHLRWDFVYQRPQQLISRIAAKHKVFFVEEPRQVDVPAGLFTETVASNVLRCVPRSAGSNGFDDCTREELAPTLRALLARHGIERHVAWLYTPMATPLARALRPAAIVYDCMDELSAFAGAPPALVEREDELFECADVVFTGGPSLYRYKRRRHPDVHCFPSSVDAAHFGQAMSKIPEPADQLLLPNPRLGFYGVLDERLDRDLVANVADARPEWQLVMVGPAVKIDRNTLPRRPNIHYFGQRAYEELPAFLAGWDVCLLPFALNDATRFISPTKVLEYMAAEKPIVSTSIADVAEPYGDVVHIADGADAFVAACERALNELPSDCAARVAGMREILSHTSWDATVRRMAAIVDSKINTPNRITQWQDKVPSSSAPARQA